MAHPTKQQRQQFGGGREGGEVRKIHVVYFLSRNGKTDQPHLMRIHHRQSSGGGVRLSDVKRWMSELRGKDMPESYSWSYKRRYKTGYYVWQDLMGDDLITPFDDNEYVLKGTLISSMPDVRGEGRSRKNKNHTVTLDQRKEVVDGDDDDSNNFPPRRSPIRATYTASYVDASTQTSPRIAEPRRTTAVFKLDLSHQPGTSEPGAKTNKPRDRGKKTAERTGVPTSSSEKCKSGGGGKGIAACVFRNLITCGDTDTSKSTAVVVDERAKTAPSSSHHNRGNFGDKTTREFRTKSWRPGERSCPCRFSSTNDT